MYFSATSCEKCVTFADFRKKKKKNLRVWATNLDKNRTFKIVRNEKKNVNFADFQQSNSIHMQPIAKKSAVQNISCITA